MPAVVAIGVTCAERVATGVESAGRATDASSEIIVDDMQVDLLSQEELLICWVVLILIPNPKLTNFFLYNIIPLF